MHFRAYFHVVGIVIFRPLLNIDVGVPKTGRSPASLCIYHCDGILEHMRSLKVTRPAELVTGSICILNLCYMCVFTLVSILDTHLDARALFSEACEHLAKLTAYWPAAEALLKGAEALSRQLRVSLPRESLPHFTSSFLWSDPSDVPVSWNVPRYEEIADVLSEEGSFDVDDPTDMGIDLGKLIRKWNSMSIQS